MVYREQAAVTPKVSPELSLHRTDKAVDHLPPGQLSVCARLYKLGSVF